MSIPWQVERPPEINSVFPTALPQWFLATEEGTNPGTVCLCEFSSILRWKHCKNKRELANVMTFFYIKMRATLQVISLNLWVLSLNLVSAVSNFWCFGVSVWWWFISFNWCLLHFYNVPSTRAGEVSKNTSLICCVAGKTDYQISNSDQTSNLYFPNNNCFWRHVIGVGKPI